MGGVFHCYSKESDEEPRYKLDITFKVAECMDQQCSRLMILFSNGRQNTQKITQSLTILFPPSLFPRRKLRTNAR
jgi:hypothetical protein